MMTRTDRGFTLMETLVVISLLSTIGVAMGGIIQYFYQKNGYLLEQTAALDSARRGILDTVHFLRQASYGDDGAYPLQAVTSSSITFYSDSDDDGTVERMRYYVEDGTLYRGVTQSAGAPPSYADQPEQRRTVATHLQQSSSTPLFTYLDAGGSALPAASSSLAQIAAIGINLEIDLNPARGPDVFVLTETATLRNIQH